ncbi:MAG: TonB-dependent receptor [Acidobacteria bacterium]|nr:TonB-dependent receptor [Acidobacteriota bacterium]
MTGRRRALTTAAPITGVWRTLCTVALLVALVAPVGAQEITGSITGVVRDASGAVVPGVTVTATHTTRASTTEVVSSATGVYTLPFLPIGTYDLTFSLPGFQGTTIRGVALHVNDRLDVNATMELGAITDTIEVVGGGSLIQYTPQIQSLMGATQVQELPLNNRNFVQLATLVPGVNSSLPDEVGIGLTSVVSLSMAGNRRNAVNWLVDGASNVDVGSNVTLLSTPSLESIEEFRVITTGYNAEWPRSGGGIVNIVTKSGSNVFRGSGYEFFRHDALNANSWTRNQSTDPQTANNPPRLRYNNFGYTASGPALRDRLFFFWSQEWRQISRAPASAVSTTINPDWLNDPTNANYVAPADRDPNAVRLLGIWPQPNLGVNSFQETRPNDQDTRQEVVRMDWQMNNRWRLMGRYTHDLSMTTEPGGLFFGVAVPNVATTLTDVPGHVLVTQLITTIRPNLLNELSFQLSGNAIKSEYGPNVVNRRDAFNLAVPELFAENRNALIPTISIAAPGPSLVGAPQLFDNQYRNYTLSNNLSWQRGNHSIKGGLLMAFEQKDEKSGSETQGRFVFGAGGGRTGFQNFLLGNRDGVCGNTCTYTEPEREVFSQFRFNRYEFYAQDSWRPRSNVTLDYGLRYALHPPVTDREDVLTNFSPGLYDPARAPQLNAAGSVIPGTGDPLNGIIVATVNSPHDRGIYQLDKNNLQPRVGFSWDVFEDARTVMRGGYGIYYDQPLVGIFLQNAFVNPPFVESPQVLNAQLSNPGAGISPTAVPVRNLIASSDPFQTPRTQQWNLGVQRQLYARGVVDVTYVGTAGDNLIQPVQINQPQPQDVVNIGVLNAARSFRGYGNILMRQTTAKSRYNGMLMSFRHDQGRAGLLNISYTLSRTMTDATNDRDAADIPQNPLDLDAEYALARTDRTHVFTANYVYELPFFRDAGPLLQSTLGGWQLSGITYFWSGNPIPQITTGNTNGLRRGSRVNQIGDPRANLPANVPGGVYWFNPAAFQAPADGTYGNSSRAPFRLPGVNQWDLSVSKNWYPVQAMRLQFRAEMINAFNHTQFTGINASCPNTATSLSCEVAGSRFGQLTGTRAPREIQLGLRLSWR